MMIESQKEIKTKVWDSHRNTYFIYELGFHFSNHKALGFHALEVDAYSGT